MNRQSESQLQPKTDSPIRGGILQRKCACGQHANGEECEECRKKQQKLQRRRNREAEPSEVPPIVHEVLRSPAQPLDARARDFLEPRFGQDFSQVRVHADARAALSAQAVGALAYTVGRDVVFGSGQYSPQTLPGRDLLAHELTHVVQQSGIPSRGTLTFDRSAGAEREADAIARSAVLGEPLASPRSTVQAGLQRRPLPADMRDLDSPQGARGGRGSGAPSHFLECVKEMGEENRQYCGEEWLGYEPLSPCCRTQAVPKSAGTGAAAPKPVHSFQAEFENAAEVAGVPVSWATDADLVSLVSGESGFNPAAKNKSSGAFGLFQMVKSTWKAQLPEVAFGSTDVCCQALGGFRYIKKAYGDPTSAWKFFQATTRKNPSLAPVKLQKKAKSWIDKGWGGY